MGGKNLKKESEKEEKEGKEDWGDLVDPRLLWEHHIFCGQRLPPFLDKVKLRQNAFHYFNFLSA